MLVCKAKNLDQLKDIGPLVKTSCYYDEKAYIIALAKKRANYLESPETSIYDDGFWNNVIQLKGQNTPEYLITTSFINADYDDPFQVYYQKYGITKENAEEFATTQKESERSIRPLEDYFAEADKGILTVDDLEGLPEDIQKEIKQRLKENQMIRFTEEYPEIAAAAIKRWRENGISQTWTLRIIKYVDEKFPPEQVVTFPRMQRRITLSKKRAQVELQLREADNRGDMDTVEKLEGSLKEIDQEFKMLDSEPYTELPLRTMREDTESTVDEFSERMEDTPKEEPAPVGIPPQSTEEDPLPAKEQEEMIGEKQENPIAEPTSDLEIQDAKSTDGLITGEDPNSISGVEVSSEGKNSSIP